MFIIPDEYMDARTCTECHKYLTVGPVKKYCGEAIKCGRCTEPDDEGLVQNLKFPAKGVFKCVNKFDGCRRLLTYDQAAKHEATCRSMLLKCPCCREPALFPSYALLTHFQAHHKQYLLKTASFGVQLTTSGYRVFLHKLKDNLFLIRCKVHPSRSFELQTSYLGQGAVIPKFKYAIHFGDEPCKIVTEPRPCSTPNSFSRKGFICRPPTFIVQRAFVQVHFNLEESEIHLAENVLVGPKCRVSLPRTIRLSDAESSRFLIGPSLTSIILDRVDQTGESPGASTETTMDNYSEFFMHCFTCWTTTSLEPGIFMETGPLMYQAVCETCANFFQRKLQGLPILLGSELVPELVSVNIAYSCVWQVWGCPQYLPHAGLDEHEANCPLQPPRKCPVTGCDFHGKLPDIKEHFELSHPTLEVALSNGPLLLDRCPGSTTTSYYIWAYYGFILVEISPHGDDEFQITLPNRRKLETFGQPRPKLMVLGAATDEATLVSDETPCRISNGSAVYVSCFFPDDD